MEGCKTVLAIVVVRPWVDDNTAEAAARRFSRFSSVVGVLTSPASFRSARAEPVGDAATACLAIFSVEEATALGAEICAFGELHAEVALASVASTAVEGVATTEALSCGRGATAVGAPVPLGLLLLVCIMKNLNQVLGRRLDMVNWQDELFFLR